VVLPSVAGEVAGLCAGVDVHGLVAIGGLGLREGGDQETKGEHGSKGNLHRGPFYR